VGTRQSKLSGPFVGMEIRIDHLPQIRHTDYIRGYFTISIPTLVLALVIWALLELLAHTRFAIAALRPIAGMAAFFLFPAIWLYAYSKVGMPFGWPYRGSPFEIAGMLAVVLLLLYGKRPPSAWIAILVVIVHLVFWYWLPSGEFEFHMPDWKTDNYFGSYGMIVPFCSTVVWVIYVTRLRHGAAEEPSYP